MFTLLAFLANTTGTPKCWAATQAMPMPEALPLCAHGAEQGNVHLVVQKGVHLQNATRFHHALTSNALFQQLHILHPSLAPGTLCTARQKFSLFYHMLPYWDKHLGIQYIAQRSKQARAA